jgi:hypothetical protein
MSSTTTDGGQAVAMIPTLFSISGLSVELGLDRRTVARRMAKIPPDGKLDKGHGWYLATALRALGNGRRAPIEDDDVMERNPVDAAICVAMVMVATRAPAEMAVTAIRAGASVDLARAIFKDGTARARAMVNGIIDELEIERDPDHRFPPPRQPDWEALAR